MFGSHLSIAGGLHNALLEAQGFGMDCVQVFTKNQRQWKCPPLTDEQVRCWGEHRARTGVQQVISHDSYLINLASPDDEARARSMALFREELLRCEALAIPFLVTHPGAHMGAGEEAGLQRVAESLDQLHQELAGLKTITCLEITAGQGTALGHTFAHLAQLRARVRVPERVGYCLDTAHLLAAGYDLTSGPGARAVLQEADEALGLEHVHALHVNDSKTPRGSRVDRHDHIGKGHVSQDAFRVVLAHPAFRRTPKILETPKAKAPDGQPWDALNLAELRRLAGPKRAR